MNKSIDELIKIENRFEQFQIVNKYRTIKIRERVNPLKYVAELIYNDNAKDHFDSAVRIIILILIFVFDPLAVLLLIAANISLNQQRDKRDENKTDI